MIEKNERLPLAILFIHSFFNGLALVYFETTANTLFLMHYDVTDLPYVYILSALVSVVIGYFYTKLENFVNVKKLLLITLIFALLVVSLFFVSIKFYESKMIYMLIMVFKDIMWIFVGMEFGILIGIIFNIRQGKRLFGYLMSGEILAGIIGGVSIGFIIDMIDTVSLLIISSISFVVSLLILIKILEIFSNRFNDDDNIEDLDSATPYKEIFENKYYLLFFAVSILSFFVFYFIDYAFYHKVEESFTNEKELVSFFGLFFAILSAVNLFSSVFISGRVLSRLGVIFGLLAIPLMAILGTGSLLLVSSLGAALVIMVIVKLFNEVFDISLLTPTFRMLYQVIPLEQRIKVLAFKETIVEPIAMAVVGIALLVISQYEDINLVFYIIFISSLLWLFLAIQLRKQYLHSLEKIVDKRVFYTDDALFEGVDKSVLLKGLSTDNEIQILYYLNLIEKFEYDDLHSVLNEFISHKYVNVRKSILHKIDTLNEPRFLDLLQRRIQEETSEDIYPTLITTYCKVGKNTVVDKVSKYLNHENIHTKVSAISGLFKYCGSEAKEKVHSVLNELFKSDDYKKQKTALLVLAEIGVEEFFEEFLVYFNSDNYKIKKLAIALAGKHKVVKLVPAILENLNSHKYNDTAVASLIECNNDAYSELTRFFKITDDLDKKIIIIKILSKIKTEESNQFLMKLAYEPLFMESTLVALYESGYIETDQTTFDALMHYIIENILVDLIRLDSFNKEIYPNTYLILKELLDVKINNIFLVLGFKYSKKVLSQVRFFSNTHVDAQSYIIELLDNILPIEVKKIVLPILDNISLEKKLMNYDDGFINYTYEENDFFTHILHSGEIIEILKISLIYEIGKNKVQRYKELINKITKSNTKSVQETLNWAQEQFDTKESNVT